MTTAKFSTISALHSFDHLNSTWQSYRDRINFYFKANKIVDNDDKKALFLWSVGDSSYGLLESLTAPDLLTDGQEEDPDLAAAEKIIQVAERLEQDVRQFNSWNNTNLPIVAKLQQKKSISKYSSSNGKSFSTTTSNLCQSCGSTTHSRSECKYRTFTCNFCKRTDHLERACQKKEKK
ncbi:unnamed protein product [Adineta steineri]|uniref:CCHC-type domain-containing protein n=1 Tax=Adineta steineri TaxID=433720 RepID=A0A813SH07_9BILA|nr:unnamed protein product [Adineta steineri]